MKKVILFIFCFVLLISVSPAFAHPFLEESSPSASTTVGSDVEQVVIHFSEAVDVDFSVIKVLDSNGNQVDNKDTQYLDKESSLMVTTPLLEDGVYTVTTKVLSKIDGHLVDYAFIFGIGDVQLDTSVLENEKNYESVFVPESIARYPGIVGQIIILGAAISTFLVWKPVRKIRFFERKLPEIDDKFDEKFSKLFAVGILSVIASNLAMLSVQTWRLDASAIDALQTTFGMTWSVRMGFSIALVIVWLVLSKIKVSEFKQSGVILALSLLLIGTTTMMGHGAASEQAGAMILDYAHSLLAALWIGGIIFFAFVLLPVFSQLDIQKRDKLTLISLPRYSTIIIIALGILFITGPTLLWFFESNVNSLTNSSYGLFIIAKIIIGAGMIGIGGYNQFKIFKDAEKNISTSKIFSRLNKTLRMEIVLGIALLGFVAFLTNTGLPAGEIDLESITSVEDRFVQYTDNTKFDLLISPFGTGTNQFELKISDLNGNSLPDLTGTKIKVSNPARNITPITIEMTEDKKNSVFTGEATFGFSGTWNLEIEAQRTQQANENVRINVLVKPDIENINAKITEIDFPEEAAPLYPHVDNSGNIWISDPQKPRIWKYSPDEESFVQYQFDGISSIALEIDNEENIWFTDIPSSSIGYFEPSTEAFNLIELPKLEPADGSNIPISLLADNTNNIWISITDKNSILRYDKNTKEFEAFELPTKNSGPFALELGPDNKIWFTESFAGKIGHIDPQSKEITEFSSEQGLEGPEDLVFDKFNNLWIAEHTGNSISKFNPALETFEKITVMDSEALPFGMGIGKYENLWFAQHVVDKIGVYDPQDKKLSEIEIPSPTSFVQFIDIDDEGNIWAVEQQANKLAKIELSEIPNLEAAKSKSQDMTVKYPELVAPLLSAGIIIASILFIKGVQDKRRIDEKFSLKDEN